MIFLVRTCLLINGYSQYHRDLHHKLSSLSAALPFKILIACSKRSDSGERCEVKIAIKSRGGLGREVRVPSLTSPPPSLLFFSRSFLLRTAPHYLNAWNRLKFS